MMKTTRLAGMVFTLLALALLMGSQAAKAAPAAAGVTVIVNERYDYPLDPLDATQCRTGAGPTICTLRAAVMFANRHGGGTIILPALPGGYYVYAAPAGADDDASGDINITQDLSLVGEGSLSTSIVGNGTVRLLKVAAGVKVSISGVTLLGGNAENVMADPSGGAIYNLGTLTLDESVISFNVAIASGGVYNGGTLTLNNSTISHNTSRNYAGGIRNFGGTITLNNSTVSANTAQGQSVGGGGGIYTQGTLVLNNSTVSGNKAPNGSGGGILQVNQSTTVLRNATIVLNQAVHGQGIYMTSSGLRLANTIVAENSHTTGGDRDDCNGTVQSDGYNIVGVSNCTGLAGTDMYGSLNNPLDPLLDYLLHFGGGTETHAIKPGSPAIYGGNPAGCTDHLGNLLGTDQRGYFRPGPAGIDSRCDIGAFQHGSVGGDVNGDGAVDSADWTVAPSRWHGSWLAWDADASGRYTMHDLMRLRSCLDLRNTGGLVSLWRAEANSDDALCRNHAQQRGGIRTTSGKVGQAFDFDGTDDYLLVPDDASLEPVQVTLEAWVRHNGSPGTFVYIADKSPGSPAASYALYTGGDGGMYFYIYNPAAAAGATSPASGTFLWDGNWHHVAGTYDGATVRLYVDGSQIGTGTAGTSGIGYGRPDDNLYVGVNGSGFGAYTGDLDEVALWGRALSATEVCQRALKSVCP